MWQPRNMALQQKDCFRKKKTHSRIQIIFTLFPAAFGGNKLVGQAFFGGNNPFGVFGFDDDDMGGMGGAPVAVGPTRAEPCWAQPGMFGGKGMWEPQWTNQSKRLLQSNIISTWAFMLFVSHCFTLFHIVLHCFIVSLYYFFHVLGSAWHDCGGFQCPVTLQHHPNELAGADLASFLGGIFPVAGMGDVIFLLKTLKTLKALKALNST